jgi:hypothetical protein
MKLGYNKPLYILPFDHRSYFMFELLVPATVEQMERLEGDHAHYDRELRPSLMMGAIKELQAANQIADNYVKWVHVFKEAEKRK